MNIYKKLFNIHRSVGDIVHGYYTMTRVALKLGRRTSDREVAGSTPCQTMPRNNFRQVVHSQYASVTELFNLVSTTGQSCSSAGKVSAGLTENNGSLSRDLEWISCEPTLVNYLTLVSLYEDC